MLWRIKVRGAVVSSDEEIGKWVPNIKKRKVFYIDRSIAYPQEP
jgi:hypothetical protein